MAFQIQSAVGQANYLFISSAGWNCWDSPLPGDTWGWLTQGNPILVQDISRKRGHGCDTGPASFVIVAVSSFGVLQMSIVQNEPFEPFELTTEWAGLSPSVTLTATLSDTGLLIAQA